MTSDREEEGEWLPILPELIAAVIDGRTVQVKELI